MDNNFSSSMSNNRPPRFSLTGNGSGSTTVGGNSNLQPKKSILRTPGRQSIQPLSYYSNNNNTTNNNNNNNIGISNITPIKFNSSLTKSNNLSSSINNTNNMPTFLNDSTPTSNSKNRVGFSNDTQSQQQQQQQKQRIRYSISGDQSQNYTNNKQQQPLQQSQTQQPPVQPMPTLNSSSNFFNKFFSQSTTSTAQPPLQQSQQPTQQTQQTNYNNREDDEMIDYPNESFVSGTSSKYRSNYGNNNTNNNITNNDSLIASPESVYHQPYTSNSLNSSGNGITGKDGASNTPAKKKKKSMNEKVRDLINYPVDKFDEIVEDIQTFHNNQYYKTTIYVIAISLNLILLGYSIDLLNSFVAFFLFGFSCLNTFMYFNSSKTSYLYRYESSTFKSPNMSITQIESPSGSIDNVIVLKSWEPKFPSKILFTLFSPLTVLIMIMASGADFEKFVVYTMISISVSYLLYFFNEKYEEKVTDEKILFQQLCQEYSAHMVARPMTRSIGCQTN